jgi:hypothetical protein
MGNGFWLYREVQSIIAIVCLSLRWHCATAYGSKEVILLSVFYGTAKARALIRSKSNMGTLYNEVFFFHFFYGTTETCVLIRSSAHATQ